MNNRFLIFLVIILFLIKIIATNFTNFDLFGDEAQYWLWSQDLDFGYFSKPPFLAWAMSAHTKIFGDSFFSLKLLPSFVYFITAWSLYILSKNIGLSKKDALSCSLIFLFIPAVSFSTFIISTDIFLLLFWTLSLNELVKIINLPKIKNFILLGVFLGLAFLSKYAAVYFIICLLIYVLLDINFRYIFVKNYLNFSLSFLCIFLVIFPNIIWNINNGWVTLQHTSDNANFNNLNVNFYRGAEFLFIQIIMVGPLLFFGNVVNYKKFKFDKYQKFFLIFSLPIFIIVLVEAIMVRANANWAAPALISLFIFLYIGLKNNIYKKLNLFFNFVFCFVFFIFIGTSYSINAFKRINGIGEFVENIYIESSKLGINNFVVSDRLLFANISYQLRNRGLSFYMPHKAGSKITNHFKISSSLKNDMNKNFIFIGRPNEINYLQNNYYLKKGIVPTQDFTSRKLNIYEVKFN